LRSVPRFLTIVLAMCALALPHAVTGQSLTTDSLDLEARVGAVMAKLTPEQELDLLAGGDDMFLRGVPKIGMPQIKFSDGPAGVRVWGPSTAFPTGIALAATWDTDLVQRVGEALGRNARARGVHVLLGPGMNIYRSPLGGRNFEYFGEDPFLASKVAVAYIRGVQSQGVIATAKHYLANDSEYDRHHIDALVDERTLREIYLPPFEAAVKEAHVGAVMNSYNLLNGLHTTQNDWLDTTILKNEWGFDGILMSDWDATYDGMAAAKAGLDLEMPRATFMKKETLLAAIRSGQVSQTLIDDKVRRLLRTFLKFGFFDREQQIVDIPLYDQKDRDLARQAALASIVLLKNDRLLPLHSARTKTIAVIGPDAHPAVVSGGGSGYTTPFVESSFLTGLSDMLRGRARVLYASGLPPPEEVFATTVFGDLTGHPGLQKSVFTNANFEGRAIFSKTEHSVNSWRSDGDRPEPEATGKNISVRWKGVYIPNKTGKFLFLAVAAGGDVFHIDVDEKGEILSQSSSEGDIVNAAELGLVRGQPIRLQVDYVPQSNSICIGFGIKAFDELVPPDARKIALNADAVVLSVGFSSKSEGEGRDRSFALPWGQDALIETIADLNPKTIVNVTAGGSFDTAPWLGHVAALIDNWYPGQDGGSALARILFGESSPEGKLPISFERAWEENPTHNSYYPNVPGPGHEKEVRFTEGLLLGYRYFTTSGQRSVFPFGFGLSYSTFAYTNLRVSSDQVSIPSLARNSVFVTINIRNTGTREAAEIAELYVSDPSAKAMRPERELKGFQKVRLRPGETKEATFQLDARAFSYYDTTVNEWRIDPGAFRIRVGPSSQDISLEKDILVVQ
jgi:beta-glucosidase